jgi:hypothetical protein
MTMTPPKEPLQEKDFIQESYSKNPFPFWLWLFFGAIIASLLWGGLSWYQNTAAKHMTTSPFLQVTNRQMSLFLWQFPEYMRINTKLPKSNYLPGFQYQNKISMELAFADDYVVAPPGIIFMYHTWDRLISKEIFPRAITVPEFQEFLNYCEEWKPRNWPNAPKEYVQFISNFPASTNLEDLQKLSSSVLPLEVRQAFQGWKNYVKEGDLITNLNPSYRDTIAFLREAPHYNRNYWRNPVKEVSPNYLLSIFNDKVNETTQGSVPKNEVVPFLKLAIFNYVQASKGK